MVKDHSIVRKETRCRHIGYSFRLAEGFFYMHHPTDRIAHITAFVTPVVEHWLEREIAQWDRSDDPSHHERTFYLCGYMASDIWLRTILIVRKETRCCHIGYSYRFFYMHHPTDRITHTTAFVTPFVEHCLERELAQWVHPMKDRSDDPSHHERTLYLWATPRSPKRRSVGTIWRWMVWLSNWRKSLHHVYIDYYVIRTGGKLNVLHHHAICKIELICIFNLHKMVGCVGQSATYKWVFGRYHGLFWLPWSFRDLRCGVV